MKHHPIQLLNVQVEELSIKALDRVSFADKEYPKTFDYTVGRTDFNEETKQIAVKVDLSIKPDEDETIDRPFSLLVSVSAHFSVDTEVFPMDKIYNWAMHNAPIVILPYVREHVYSLSLRAGFEPVMLPLVEVPTVKIVKNND